MCIMLNNINSNNINLGYCTAPARFNNVTTGS